MFVSMYTGGFLSVHQGCSACYCGIGRDRDSWPPYILQKKCACGAPHGSLRRRSRLEWLDESRPTHLSSFSFCLSFIFFLGFSSMKPGIRALGQIFCCFYSSEGQTHDTVTLARGMRRLRSRDSGDAGGDCSLVGSCIGSRESTWDV